jgi:hypothetical protein
MCCGEEGRAARAARDVSPQRGSAQPLPPTPGTQIDVVFTGIGDCVVTGSQSSKEYFFTSDDPEHPIDVEDAAALLSSGFFRRASYPC